LAVDATGTRLLLTAADREAFLLKIAPFATLPDRALAAVAAQFEIEHRALGSVIFREGDEGDRLFMIVSGQAELSAIGTAGQVPLTTLGPGEMLGELALLSPGAKRNATLVALTPLALMSLAEEKFRAMLAAHPETATAFDLYAERLLTARFIKSVGPFMTLDDPSRRWLAGRVTHRSVPAGQTIIRQGTPGDSCFILREGRVEVVVEDQGRERMVASMGPGSIFGEAALLTGAQRTATVRATAPCEVFELKRHDLDELLDRRRSQTGHLVQLFRLQERPRRADGVLLSERTTPDGDTITILKHPVHLTYYRLSERGRFIWEQLDGYHDMRALTLEYLREFRQIAPDVIGHILDGLARTKMIETGKLSAAFGEQVVRPSLTARVLIGARRMLDIQVPLRNIDLRITAAYNRGIRLLFTRPAQLLLAVIAIAGVISFVLTARLAHHVLSGQHKALLLLIIPGIFASVFLHEAAHAFTVKAFGREVNRGGIGWYWFGPMAFIDTSDMWLASRRQRILVSLAGPYADTLTAGLASIGAFVASSAVVSALLWSFALGSYLAVLRDLNPLLEFDGYHILSDLLDRPNLRAEAFGWFGSHFPMVLRDRQALRAHAADLVYSLGSLLYIGASVVAVVVLYRLTVRGFIATIVPEFVANALAWVLAIGLTGLVTLGTVADLRAKRRVT
jgi:putative peptide zinc metalloprotease protein